MDVLKIYKMVVDEIIEDYNSIPGHPRLSFSDGSVKGLFDTFRMFVLPDIETEERTFAGYSITRQIEKAEADLIWAKNEFEAEPKPKRFTHNKGRFHAPKLPYFRKLCILRYYEAKLKELQSNSHSSKPIIQPEITFENLFVSPDAMRKALDLAIKVGMINIEYKYQYGKRKYQIAAYWWFLEDRKPEITTFQPAQKAIEIIANYFGTNIGENYWSNTNPKKDQNAIKFYQKMVEVRGIFGDTL